MVHYIATDDGAHHDDQANNDKHAGTLGKRVDGSHVSQDAGAAHWLTIHDDLLRGLAHAFSNRVATVVAIAAHLDPSRAPDERLLHGLRSDVDRLEELLKCLRQLPRRGEGDPEPMLPLDGVTAALALFAHHPAYGSMRCTVGSAEGVPPVRADPLALQHALCVALVSACRAGGDVAGVAVALSTDGEVVRIAVSAEGGHGEGEAAALAQDVSAVDWLLAGSHGRGSAAPLGCTLELPTLQASRRRP